MKKYMIADLMKDIRSDSISQYVRQYETKSLYDVDQRSIEYYKKDLEHIDLNLLERPFQIDYLMREYQLNSDEAYYLADNWQTEADWKLVMEAAEVLNVGIEDIEDDDVENMNSGAGASGEVESSMGIIKYLYDNKTKAYVLLLMLDGRPVMYQNLDPYRMNELSNADSAGEYYNDNIRGDESIELCGCKANDCNSADLAIFDRVS